MTLVSLLITLVIFALVIWAVQTILPALKVPPPISTVIWVVVVVVMVLWLISRLTGYNF